MSKKIRITANALEDVDVAYVSLVKRGANRMPFKVVKSEESNMKAQNSLDLSSLYKTVSHKPELVAIVVPLSKGEDFKKSIEEQTELRIHTVKSDAEQGADLLIVSESGVVNTDHRVFKMNDEIAIVMNHVEKSFESYPDTSDFGENMKKASFFPSFFVATDMLRETMYNAMNELSDGDSAVQKVEGVLADYSHYVTGLAAAIPESAIKLEGIVLTAKAEKDGDEAADSAKAGDEAAAAADTETAKADDAKAGDDAATETTKADDTAAETTKTEDAAEAAETAKAEAPTVAEQVATAMAGPLAEVMGVVKTLATEVAAIAKTADDATAAAADAGTKADTVTAKADSIIQQTQGTLITSGEAGDADHSAEHDHVASKADLAKDMPSNVEFC